MTSNGMVDQHIAFSIVVLTYNRRERIAQHMELFADIKSSQVEIIIVDNGSDEPIDDLVSRDKRAILVMNKENLGAVGRNSGLKIARGDIIITLDDDVYGICDEHLLALSELMSRPDIAAIVFQVEEEGTRRIINWCHPYDQLKFFDQEFETNDISEGAVAFRRTALKQVGLYPEYFFISHEGPDMACRLINAGWKIMYNPRITVIHGYEQKSRVSWRRYYFDTRNTLWLVVRNFPVFYGLKKLAIGWGSMLVYAIRDGYLRYWFRGIIDSLKGTSKAFYDRTPPNRVAWQKWAAIQKNKPGIWCMIWKRLFNREVRI